MDKRFPLLRKVSFSEIGCRPGTEIRLEVNCDGLPHSVDPIVHFEKGMNGTAVRETVIFSTPLHPSHVPGMDLQDDDAVSKNGGADELVREASRRLEPRASLAVAYAVEFVRFTLSVRGSHDLTCSMSLEKLKHLLDTSVKPRRSVRPAKKRKKIPSPKASRVRKSASAS